MAGESVGYEFLKTNFRMALPPLKLVARTASTSRIMPLEGGVLGIPRHATPDSQRPVDHLQFALKHEGVNLGVIREALTRIDGGEIIDVVANAPTGRYPRLLGFLWEYFNRAELEGLPSIQGPTESLFDEERYFVGPAVRNAKWRVAFNGIGTLYYCASIERTPELVQAAGSRLLERAEHFVQRLDESMRERAVEWAYLSETMSSFEIEREAPNDEKARRFMRLLHSAHERQALSEERLVEFQNAVVSNPYDQAVEYRNQQNYLTNSNRGPTGVTYIPPPKALCRELMGTLLDLANVENQGLDPVLRASVVKFGFAFLHPFMDGNGRLSRFLFHKVLCTTGALQNGLLLPVSVAMKRNERGYLAALESFSKPTRSYWKVEGVQDAFECQFGGAEAIYRYWDATPCAEFGYRMAQEALDVDLRKEAAFLERYDRVYSSMNERFDVRNSTMSTLILSCLEHRGRVSQHRRAQFAGKVPPDFFDALEQAVNELEVQPPAPETPSMS